MLVLLPLLLVVTSQATAHSGGTNKYGCHAGSQPYHCHNSKTPSEPSYPDIEERKPSYPDYKTELRETPPKSLVAEFYDKITGSIAYGLRLIRKKPSVVKSCEEWVMVMKLMASIALVTPKRLASLEGKCYEVGHRRFGNHMKRLIEKLPIRLSK